MLKTVSHLYQNYTGKGGREAGPSGSREGERWAMVDYDDIEDPIDRDQLEVGMEIEDPGRPEEICLIQPRYGS